MSDYAGDLSPLDTWSLLKSTPAAVMVDVRTDAEWNFVGQPDLSSLNKAPIRLSWQIFPTMMLNGEFVDAVRAAVPDPATPIAFLCRSGVRSLAAARALTAVGYTACYNIADGFEGPPDGERHRGRVAGWKASNLPWAQG